MVQIPGKKGRTVPMLITEDVKEGLEVLNNKRDQVGIPQNNPFCFASRSQHGYLDGWQAMNLIAKEANLSKPELVTSTKLRKYNATVSQLFDLTSGELEWLSNHMGHDLNIHKDFYRLHESTIEMTKVSKLLLAVDKGEASKFAGKQLDEIDLNDMETDVAKPSQLETDNMETNVAKPSQLETDDVVQLDKNDLKKLNGAAENAELETDSAEQLVEIEANVLDRTLEPGDAKSLGVKNSRKRKRKTKSIYDFDSKYETSSKKKCEMSSDSPSVSSKPETSDPKNPAQIKKAEIHLQKGKLVLKRRKRKVAF